MPYSYTNRQGKTRYFRAVETKTGKFRYYVTTSDQYPDLIEEIPKGYEVAELPEEARIVIRKQKPIWITPEEKEIVQDAIAELSDIKDFFIHTDQALISVYHSQFNYEGGQEPNLTRAEAIEVYGENIERWMRFFTALRFRLIDRENRIFQTERMVYTGFFTHSFYTVGEPGPIEALAQAYGQHLGRESFFRIEPNDM